MSSNTDQPSKTMPHHAVIESESKDTIPKNWRKNRMFTISDMVKCWERANERSISMKYFFKEYYEIDL